MVKFGICGGIFTFGKKLVLAVEDRPKEAISFIGPAFCRKEASSLSIALRATISQAASPFRGLSQLRGKAPVDTSFSLSETSFIQPDLTFRVRILPW
jgi:hypothetical protein